LAKWQARVAGHLGDGQFGIARLARLLGLSERTLYRRLSELAGLTPAAWLRELRLSQAQQLLEAGCFGSVAKVADAVGSALAKHLSNVCAERFGSRPSDYCTLQEYLPGPSQSGWRLARDKSLPNGLKRDDLGRLAGI